ncbi:thiol-disulfide isomerase/thioredoxin [Evansella vedderi]|uniref:Thiol-disulfide isomerase/thioredoxin n=1 Tax=Evansella vedderi TaxID=38282 RepID=A0ABT9ZVH3_9BACI|nr:thioredoxin family protein [Evansella vedderi]MDQ0255243.1 thiol-disulfide isomerase/thioredoxin [Evansella vedderi]
MKEIVNKNNMNILLHTTDVPLLLYFYTPMCGTCKMAKGFLEILENIEQTPPIYKLDINLFKEYGELWKIKSVPCLIYYEKKMPLNKLYAFESITNTYEFIHQRK